MSTPIYRPFVVAIAIAALLGLSGSAPGGGIKDAESETHDSGSARHSVVDTYEFTGFKLVQIELPVLSHFSYLLVGGAECLVVDPGRDVDFYLEHAAKEKAKIVGVWLSHSHADFVAGHAELAKRLGVPIHIAAAAGAEYEHTPLRDGDRLEVGGAVVKFLETPGHTPDGMCGLVASKSAPDAPQALLSGDTLFIGSVGRPDLMGEGMAASNLASMMFETWNRKLSLLPDGVRVFPAHGAGSLCGAHLSDEPTGTIGEQRIANPYFRHSGRGEFIAAVLEGLPDAPAYFKHNAAMNRKGPEPVDWERAPTLVQPGPDLTDPSKHYVVDIREAGEYAAGHVRNSVNIALRGRFETWVGIMVPWDSDLVLTGDEKQLQEAVRRLHRVGYRPACVEFADCVKAGVPMRKNRMCEPRKLYEAMQTPASPIVIDVRLPSEWMALRIGTVVNIPLNELARHGKKIDRTEQVVTVCNSAYRSSMAVGVLERLDFEKVCSLKGGGEAWLEEGLPVYEARGPASSPATPRMQIRLAERLSAAELKRMLLDLPGTFTVVDVRPPEQFADFNLPGSTNVGIAELLNDPGWLVGVGPLVVVDRDGSLAMMVAGILSQKTNRAVKALYGGLSAYWAESGLRTPAAPASPAKTTRPVSPSPPGETKPQRKKSAGC